MPNTSLRMAFETKQAVLSNQDAITVPLYCNRNSKHLSRPNKTPIHNKNFALRHQNHF